MPLSLGIVVGNASASAYADQALNLVAQVTNTGAAAVTLQSLQVSEATESDAVLSQPMFQAPNQPVGVGNPVLLPGVTYNYGFQAVFTSPMAAGPSPQNAPGGAAPSNAALTPDPFFTLQLTAYASDGSVTSMTSVVPVLSTIPPFPLAQGGALQLSQGANAVNLLTSFA